MVQAPRDLSDLIRHGGSISCRCKACGRVALFSPMELANYFARKGWDARWPQFAARLRCECGTRGPAVSWIITPPPPNDDPSPPRPRYRRAAAPMKPAGIDQTEWDRARDDRERRRLVRRARG